MLHGGQQRDPLTGRYRRMGRVTVDCACGCGARIEIRESERNRPHYKRMHWRARWKGGRRIDQYGYVWLRVGRGYVSEHRLVMEKYIGRPLTSVFVYNIYLILCSSL
jgi:hypothetical protein